MIYKTEIYQQFLRGERAGVAVIFLTYKELLIRFGRRYTSRNDVVEDAIAEAFELLLREIGTFEDENHIHLWLHSVVKQKCLNEVRRLKRLSTLPDEPEDQEEGAKLSTQELIEIRGSAAYIQYITGVIYRRLQKLPRQMRLDFYAHYFQLKSIAEIAWRRKAEESTVRQNIAHATKKIQKLLKKS